MNNKKRLESQIQKLRDKLGKITDAEQRAAQEKLVGKCYRYRNSYGAGGKSDWWLYVGIHSLDPENGLRAIHFQKDCDGRFEVETNHYYINVLNGYEEIPTNDFCKAWLEFQSNLAASTRPATMKLL